MSNTEPPGYSHPGLFSHLRKRRWALVSTMVVIAIIVVLVVLLGSVSIWPGLGAKGADLVRHIFGDRAAASLEGFTLSLQDSVHHIEYSLGLSHPANPWMAASGSTAYTLTTLQRDSVSHPPATNQGGTSTTTSATVVPTWAPPPLPAMGTLDGEGQWSAYLADGSGRTLAYRTALQPDPKRPYAVVAVVAMDLKGARLHFILGYKEPVSAMTIPRPGSIPSGDRKPGQLLAAFNGGFQARHGSFGAMADGYVALPPRAGLGTVAIYKDGRVDLGAWGTSITDSPNLVAWRQNGPLMVSDGVVNPHTWDAAPADWGYALHGNVATWRSGLGLSQDHNILYFVVGPSLTTAALAAALHQAGAWNAIQLDINKSWTRFDRFVIKKGELHAQPVLPSIIQDDRLLHPYSRDFFYLTAAPAGA